MKKFISLTLAVLMVMAMIPTAFAYVPSVDEYGWPGMCIDCSSSNTCAICHKCPNCDGVECDCAYPVDHSQGTKVEYTASGSEAYTITVPALLAPGDEGTVTLSGTWASDRKVTVTAADDVTLTNSINANDKHTLDVTFAGISKAGDNTQSRTYTETVAVAEMPANALFGTWSGTFYYDVEMVDAVETISFTVSGYELQAEDGMTWAKWVNSKYNTLGYICHDDGRVRTHQNVILKDSQNNWVENEHTIIPGEAYSDSYNEF